MKCTLLSLMLLVQSIYATISMSIVLSDLILNYDKIKMVTEFSCNYKESFNVLKLLTQQRTLVRILKVYPNELSHSGSQNMQIFALNLDCENSTKHLKRVNGLNYFAYPYKWIFFHTTSLDVVLEEFENLDVLIDSDITLCQLYENDTATIKGIFKYRSGYPIQIENAGYWNVGEGYNNLGMEKSIARRRNNLAGITINTCMVVTNNDTLKHLTDQRNKLIDSITKVNYILINHLGHIVNGKLNYTIQPTWGIKINNSEWNGMIGLLIKKEVDIGGTPLFFTIERVELIDYIAMTTPTRSKFVFREPKLSYVTNVFTLPFDTQVWASTIALVIITGFLIYIILKWEFKKRKTLFTKNNSSSNGISVTEVALISFGAVCQQGSPTIPISISGRIVTILLFISLMFLYTSYSANIVALLQSSSSSIQTLQDLLNSRLKVGVDDTIFNRIYFPLAKEPIRKALYEQKIASVDGENQFMPLAEGVCNMRKGLFAFHMETGVGYKLVEEIFHESEKCGLKEIQFLEVIEPWLAIQKNSSYKKLFKIGLRKIQESGLQAREINLIYTKKPLCTSRVLSFISVGLVDCYPPAVVLLAGLIVSFLIWIFEIISKK